MRIGLPGAAPIALMLAQDPDDTDPTPMANEARALLDRAPTYHDALPEHCLVRPMVIPA